MASKTLEKYVVYTKDGTPISVMEDPESVGSLDEYHEWLKGIRKKYAHLLNKQSFDDYLREKHEEAERE